MSQREGTSSDVTVHEERRSHPRLFLWSAAVAVPLVLVSAAIAGGSSLAAMYAWSSAAFVAAVAVGGTFVLRSAHQRRAFLVGLVVLAAATFLGHWNPWNLLILRNLFFHPALAVVVTASGLVFLLLNSMPAERTTPSWFHVVVGSCVAGLGMAAVVSCLFGFGIGVAVPLLAVLGGVVAFDWSATRWRAPVLTPTFVLVLLLAYATLFGALGFLFGLVANDDIVARSPTGELVLLSQGGKGCREASYVLRSGEGARTREVAVDGGRVSGCNVVVSLEGANEVRLTNDYSHHVRRMVVDVASLAILCDDDSDTPCTSG